MNRVTRSRRRLRGFSGSSPSLYKRRSSPRAHPERENISGCIHVAVENQSTVRAVMHPHSEGFLDDDAAATAALTRTAWIDFHDFTPSFFRFDAKPMKEVSPPGIIDRFGQHPASQSLDAQFFDTESVVLGNKRLGDEDVILTAHVGYVGVFLGQQTHSQAAAVAPSFASTHPAGGPFNCDACRLHRAWILKRLPVAGCRERRQPKVNADFASRLGQRLCRNVHAGKSHVPVAVTFEFDPHSLGRALDGTVLFKFHLAEQWDGDALAASDDRRLPVEIIDQYRLESATSLEAGITWCISRLAATEEASKSAIQAAKRTAQDYHRHGSKLGTVTTDFRKLRHLIKAGDGYMLLLPSVAFFLEPAIIEFAGKLKPGEQDGYLRSTRIEPVAVGSGHVI